MAAAGKTPGRDGARPAPTLGEMCGGAGSRIRIGKIDAHMHAHDVGSLEHYFRIAGAYGVHRATVITHVDHAKRLKQHFGSRIELAIFFEYDPGRSDARNRRDGERLLDQAVGLGARTIKFWFTPHGVAENRIRLDDDRLAYVFAFMGRHGLTGLVHVADPDVWFAQQVSDVEIHGAKREHHAQLSAVLERHPDVTIQGAHLGGLSEDLVLLERLLANYPNYVVDTSATKWVSREVSRRADAARALVLAYPDRFLFGSDLVASPQRDDFYYASRFWAQQHLWEGTGWAVSPIPDPDRAGEPAITGLHLPDDVLRRVYVENAQRVLGGTSRGDAFAEVNCP